MSTQNDNPQRIIKLDTSLTGYPSTSPMRCTRASLIQDQFKRENTSQPCLSYTTIQSIKVYKFWFAHLVHNTITHHGLHQSIAEVFQHNIVSWKLIHGCAISMYLRNTKSFTTPDPLRGLEHRRIHGQELRYLQNFGSNRVSTRMYSAGLTQYNKQGLCNLDSSKECEHLHKSSYTKK